MITKKINLPTVIDFHDEDGAAAFCDTASAIIPKIQFEMLPNNSYNNLAILFTRKDQKYRDLKAEYVGDEVGGDAEGPTNIKSNITGVTSA